jgi:multiple sugar transport system ATP-binding protein
MYLRRPATLQSDRIGNGEEQSEIHGTRAISLGNNLLGIPLARLRLSEVSKMMKGSLVVNELSLEVDDGEFMVVVGPSGCGKTTTLNMIAGLETPTTGRILIGDKDVTALPPKDRGVAMVFQNYALYPHLTVAGNLGFGLKMARVPASEIARRVNAISETLGIINLLERYPRELSGGQRQRIALGRAIVRDPAVFLFDEPLSNLDAQLRVQIRHEIKQLHERLRATAVYVTHDQIEAMTLGSRVVVMDHGVVQQIGPPLEIYERPANRFVAQFLGSPAMNFIDCTVQLIADQLVLQAGALRIPVSAAKESALEKTGLTEVVAGVRPEHLIVNPKVDGESVSLPAVVETVDALGNQTHLTVAVGAQRLIATTGATIAVRSQDSVCLGVPLTQVYIYQRGQYGARIA